MSAIPKELLPNLPPQFRRTADVRTAVAKALTRHLGALELDIVSARDIQKLRVFEEWADFEARHEPPSVCVLPSEGVYEDRSLSPSPLEGTWAPEAGKPGFVLWKVSEYYVPLDIYCRGRDREQRHAIIGAIEDAFVPEDLGSPTSSGDIYGIVLDVPDYYARRAVFTLLRGRTDDSPEASARNVREGVLAVTAQVEHLVVRPAVGIMSIQARTEVGGTEG